MADARSTRGPALMHSVWLEFQRGLIAQLGPDAAGRLFMPAVQAAFYLGAQSSLASGGSTERRSAQCIAGYADALQMGPTDAEATVWGFVVKAIENQSNMLTHK